MSTFSLSLTGALATLAALCTPFEASTPPIRAAQNAVFANDILAEAFVGIAFGDSVSTVQSKLKGQCAAQELIRVVKPHLPVAHRTQSHLIATEVYSAAVQKAVFTFGDDRLLMLEVRGGAKENLIFDMPGKPRSMGPLKGWQIGELGILVHSKLDVVWFLSKEALHPYLFLWQNPYFDQAKEAPASPQGSAKRPALLSFGAQLAKFEQDAKGQTSFMTREVIQQPWLPTEPEVQVQINCFGLEYAGFPRKAEAVFGDGRLQQVWVLTGKAEEARLRMQLTKAYGKPIFVSETWEAFDGFRIALRKDKPEVLMIADELIPFFQPQMEATAK